jgi:hypothetical protein
MCQEKVSNTVPLGENMESPEATLEAVAFITGHWKGNAFGGITEEIWTPPLGNSMMCAFKLVVENEVRFYEICTISEENGTLILRLKHFDGSLKGWEEKDETIDFRLVKVEKDKVFFDQFTFEKVGPDELNIYVVIDSGGKEEEVKFNYHRYSKY